MVPQRIERDIVIEAPVDVVWAVVTEPRHISRWFSDAVELDLRPGGEAVLHWHESDHRVRGRVERVEPPHFFSFRWMLRPGADVAPDNSTLVEFSLAAEGESTRLTVVESGFRDLGGADDEKQGHYDGHARGWELELGELVDYLAQRAGR
jgi:uncharacterized protein YndB with AHSA1/START domain